MIRKILEDNMVFVASGGYKSLKRITRNYQVASNTFDLYPPDRVYRVSEHTRYMFPPIGSIVAIRGYNHDGRVAVKVFQFPRTFIFKGKEFKGAETPITDDKGNTMIWQLMPENLEHLPAYDIQQA